MKQRLIFLAMALALPATAATNPHYDAKATTGELQTVCDEISIDAKAVLSASCNAVRKNSDGKKEVSIVSGEVDLSSRVAEDCMHDLAIRVTATAVYLDATCRTEVEDPGGEVKTYVESASQNLNDWVEWDGEDSDFGWK